MRRFFASLSNKIRDRSFRKAVLMYVVSVGILLLVWEIASLAIAAIKGRAFLPNPIRAIAEMIRLGPLLFRNFWISAWRLVMAIVIAFFTGYPLGLLIGHERRLDQLDTFFEAVTGRHLLLGKNFLALVRDNLVKDHGTTRAKVREMMGGMIQEDAPNADINPQK